MLIQKRDCNKKTKKNKNLSDIALENANNKNKLKTNVVKPHKKPVSTLSAQEST